LIQWECFPEQVIDYKKDIKITNAKRWTTDMTLNQFKTITKTDGFPTFLKKDLANDTTLKIYANGEINYQLKGVHAKASVIWAYKAPEGGGDTHYSIMRGTKANLIIRQGAEQAFKPTLYIEPVNVSGNYDAEIQRAVAELQKEFAGVSVKKIQRAGK